MLWCFSEKIKGDINMIYIGVDPGKTGAIAILSPSGIQIYDFTDPCGLMALRDISQGKAKAVIEKVNAMPKQGVTSVFTFGDSYGKVKGWLEALSIPYELVTPQKWQKEVLSYMPTLPVGSDQKTKNERSKIKKAHNLDQARKKFPEAVKKYLTRKMDHNRADALLIAEYCRRVHSKVDQSCLPDFLY